MENVDARSVLEDEISKLVQFAVKRKQLSFMWCVMDLLCKESPVASLASEQFLLAIDMSS